MSTTVLAYAIAYTVALPVILGHKIWEAWAVRHAVREIHRNRR